MSSEATDPADGLAESDAIKDVLRRDALCRGPWALRILDEIERLEAENERLRAALRLKESAVESTYRAYVAERTKNEDSPLLTLAATQAADVATLAAENDLLRSILGKAKPVTFNGLSIEEQRYLAAAAALTDGGES